MADVIICGPQGSGKGTAAPLIERDFRITHVQCSKLIDETEGPDGDHARALKKAGEMVPDGVIFQLVQKLVGTKFGQKLLWDGFPRTREQAEMMMELRRKVAAVIRLNLSDEQAVARAQGRRIDPVTQESFGPDFALDWNPKTGNLLVQREDDKPEKIRARLDDYRKKTEPAIEVLARADIPVIDVNAGQSREGVYLDIRSGLEDVLDAHQRRAMALIG